MRREYLLKRPIAGQEKIAASVLMPVRSVPGCFVESVQSVAGVVPPSLIVSTHFQKREMSTSECLACSEF